MINFDMGQKRRKKKRIGRPVAVICYICGRQYGRSSIEIHIRQCKKLWEQREALKPEYERKKLPTPPENFESAVNSGDFEHMDERQINLHNKHASEAYNNEALEKCPHCGRSFLEGPLQIHLRSCRPGRLIGEKLKAHSGKAGGNLGKEADPRRRRRPGTTPHSDNQPRRRNERIPISELRKMGRNNALSSDGGSRSGERVDDYVAMEPPRTAPSSSTTFSSSSSSSSRGKRETSPLMHSGVMQMKLNKIGNAKNVFDLEKDDLDQYDYRKGVEKGRDGVNDSRGIQDKNGGGRHNQSSGRDGRGNREPSNYVADDHRSRSNWHSSSSESAAAIDKTDVNTGDAIPEQWHEAWDPKSGRDFYYNNKGETRWTLPEPDDSLKRSTAKISDSNNAATTSRTALENSNTKINDRRVMVLEERVDDLEEKLDWAISEIDRLSRKLQKFQNVFESDD
jgi:hypothetical protein